MKQLKKLCKNGQKAMGFQIQCPPDEKIYHIKTNVAPSKIVNLVSQLMAQFHKYIMYW